MLPWQVHADCPHCLTAGGVEELMDPLHPACHLGVPAQARCRMCDHQAVVDAPDPRPTHPHGARRCPACAEPLSDSSLDARQCAACAWAPVVRQIPGVNVRDPQIARARLAAWAAEDDRTLDALCAELGGEPEAVVAQYAAGEPVDSGLDVLALIFPGIAAGGSAAVAQGSPVRPIRTAARAPSPADPRAPARLLASVMVADGELRQGEQAFVDRWLRAEGLAPLDPTELRPWRPHEVGPVTDPQLAARAVEAAVELMHLDGQRDGSELRMVRTFARVWGVSEARVAAWDRTYDRRHTPPAGVLWRALSRWVRTR